MDEDVFHCLQRKGSGYIPRQPLVGLRGRSEMPG